MPRRDGTGPAGAGAGSGRMRGIYCRPGSGVSGFIIQMIINNWMAIAGLIITTLVPLIGRKLYLENKADSDKISVLTARPVEKNKQLS